MSPLSRRPFVRRRGGNIVGQLPAAFPQQPLDALDRLALCIKQIRDSPQQHDIIRSVISPATAPLQRPDLRKLRLPEPQNMLRDMKIVSYLTDCAESIRSLLRPRPQPLLITIIPQVTAHVAGHRPPAHLNPKWGTSFIFFRTRRRAVDMGL